jgi:hypothetical protein
MPSKPPPKILPHAEPHRGFWLAVSAVTAGVIAGGGALLASVAENGEVSPVAVWIAGITMALAMAKDLRTYIADPP